MKKFFSILCSFILISSFVLGGKVDLNKARIVGSNFFFERINQHQQVPFSDLQVKESITKRYNGNPVYYIFNFSKGGYVIVSAIDDVPPVLTYSFEGGYSDDNQPPQFINWMEGYAKQIDRTIQYPNKPTYDCQSSWQRLLTTDPQNLDYSPLTDVPPLLISTWDQGTFYNMMYPDDPQGPGGHPWAGCVATAMSQVMYYYRWPVNGSGSHCYTPNGYPQQCADFGNTTYQWDQMVNAVGFRDTAVATLIWHAGVAVDMMYSPGGSGAYSEDALTAMISTFRYSPNAHLVARDYTPTDQYTAILRDNLDHRRVMYYDGYGTGGHAFNVDGYQGTDYFHFNWGWSGSFNGYYYLNNLNPGGDNFTNGQRAMVELYPDTTSNTYPSYCTGQHVLTALTGTFEDGSGPLESYQNNDNCSWLINPQSVSDSVIAVTLTFNRFSTESGNDVVNVYQGSTTSDPLVASFSGDNIPSSLTVNSGVVLVTFSTNGTTRKPGWYVSYASKSYDWCTGNTVTFTDPVGTLGDGSGHFNYRNSTVCRWEIDPSTGGAVQLFFTSFKTESTNDYVRVYDRSTQQLLAEYSGDYTPANLPGGVVATSGKMFVIFVSNNDATDEGWSATWSTLPVGTQNQESLADALVFPNPASDQLSVRLSVPTKKDLKIELLGVDGKVQLSVNFIAEKGTTSAILDVSGFSSGIYILRITGDEGVITKKVVIN
ncbi:MAG: C10 family peptidase [Bacteroidetes bacterium]|nr:C10 family peptidase [Bacteroidota bacterium]